VQELLKTSMDRLRLQVNNLAVLSLMLRKRQLTLLWLKTARKAQVALGIAVIALLLLAPPAATWVSDTLYPTRYEQQGPFQRLLDVRRPIANPLQDTRRTQFLVAAWTLGFGAVFLVLLSHVPRAVALGRERAAVLLTEADELAHSNPDASQALRLMAEDYVIDALTLDVVDAASRRHTATTQVIARPDRRAAVQTIGNGRYRIDRPIGSGGMGVVHAGTDTLLRRPVALKQLFSHLISDSEQSSRFRQEALALASLTHPHVVTIYDLVEFEDHFWIVMELLPGGSLADRIDARGAIPAEQSIAIACDIASGLGYAHERGIVHRDVKPMNILFTADGKPKLTDFGNAKPREPAVQTQQGHLIGSPSFMSPEQITGAAVDCRTDIYSLGISLYQMLTGRTPFAGELSSILAQHVNADPVPPGARAPGLAPEVDAAVLRMLAKSPARRYQSCAEVIAALRMAARSTARRKRA